MQDLSPLLLLLLLIRTPRTREEVVIIKIMAITSIASRLFRE